MVQIKYVDWYIICLGGVITLGHSPNMGNTYCNVINTQCNNNELNRAGSRSPQVQ